MHRGHNRGRGRGRGAVVTPRGRGGGRGVALSSEAVAEMELQRLSNAGQVALEEPETIDRQQLDATLKGWLANEPEPTLNMDNSKAQSESVTTTHHLHALRGMRLHLGVGPNAELEKKIMQLMVKHDYYYWRTFRINDLPEEILTNIFRYVIWSTTVPYIGVKYRLWITWTSKTWRSVALADSTLWNVIWFRDKPPFERSIAWLERAGSAMLDVRINEPEVVGQGQAEETEEEREEHLNLMEWILDILFQKVEQIRMMVVVVDSWPPALTLLDRLRRAGNAGLDLILERFELHRSGNPFVWIGTGFQPAEYQLPMALCGGRAPRLKSICIDGIHIDWAASSLSDLTTIDLRRIALECSPGLLLFREILSSCPRLFKLALDGAGPKWEPDRARGLPPIVFDHLKILVLGDFSLHHALYVLSQISAPHVHDLTLMNLNGEDYTTFISRMIGRFKEVRILTLYSLEVESSPAAMSTLVRWFSTMSKVMYLRLAVVPKQILLALAQAPRSETRGAEPGIPNPVFPKCDILEYQSIATPHIVNFANQRKAIGIPLRKLYINGPWIPMITRAPDAPAQENALRGICQLFITPTGAHTSEELEINRLMGMTNGPYL